MDLGCGAGHLLAGLRKAGWIGHYIGVDISPRAIRAAQQMCDSNSEWIVSPIESFPERHVDFLCFVESLYYSDDVPATLGRAKCADRVFVRIYHRDRHQDVISQLSECEKVGCIYIS